MKRQSVQENHQPEVKRVEEPVVQAPAPRFERPRVRRLGALPTVTTAFGGSFTP